MLGLLEGIPVGFPDGLFEGNKEEARLFALLTLALALSSISILTTIGAHVGVLVVDVDDKIDGIPEPAEDGVDDNEEAVDDGVDGEEPVHRPGTRSHHCGKFVGRGVG